MFLLRYIPRSTTQK